MYEPPKHDEELPWVSSPKETGFPETIPEEASSIEEERVVIFRIPSSSKPSIYTVSDSSYWQFKCFLSVFYYQADASLFQHHFTNEERSATKFDFDKIHHYSERFVC